MKLLIVLTCALAAVAARAQVGGAQSSCHGGVYLQGECYDKQTILTDGQIVRSLTVDYQTDTLFFRYKHFNMSSKLARLNLKTNEISIIEFLNNLFCLVADSTQRLLYIGTEDGIYSYGIDTYQIQFIGAPLDSVWTLFLKDGLLYYCDHYVMRLQVIPVATGEKDLAEYVASVRLRDLEDVDAVYFVLDNNNMFYNNDSALFRQKKGSPSSEAVKYEKQRSNGYLYALTLDLHGNVYAAFIDGLYSVRKSDNKLDIVIDHQIDDLTFDSNNNMIYSYNNSVYRLVPRSQALGRTVT